MACIHPRIKNLATMSLRLLNFTADMLTQHCDSTSQRSVAINVYPAENLVPIKTKLQHTMGCNATTAFTKRGNQNYEGERSVVLRFCNAFENTRACRGWKGVFEKNCTSSYYLNLKRYYVN